MNRELFAALALDGNSEEEAHSWAHVSILAWFKWNTGNREVDKNLRCPFGGW